MFFKNIEAFEVKRRGVFKKRFDVSNIRVLNSCSAFIYKNVYQYTFTPSPVHKQLIYNDSV